MPLIADASYKIGEGVTGRVAETGEPLLIRRASETGGKYGEVIRAALMKKHQRQKSIESLMVVPIIAKDQILGVMKVINKANDHLEFSPSDLKLFETFGRYVGVAIENARFYKLANERLSIAERNAALSSLVSAVAHEINNTVGLVPANIAVIKDQLGNPSESIMRSLALIERVANQATDFANELAGFATARRGEKRRLNVNELILNAIEDLQDMPRYKNSDSIQLKIALCEEALWCEIFETPFIQVVRNIVINSFQALEKTRHGAILVSTSRGTTETTPAAELLFQDNGPGILPKHIEKIFEPDFTTKPDGNGLGLWLVRTQLEQVGGTIEVDSELGKGARFMVRVPLADDGDRT